MLPARGVRRRGRGRKLAGLALVLSVLAVVYSNPYRRPDERLAASLTSAPVTARVASVAVPELVHPVIGDIEANCTDVGSRPDPCAFALAACANDDGKVDYMAAYYCTFGSVRWLGMIIFIIWNVWLFYMLGLSADDYFCPSLTSVSDKLRLSQNIAGITFLSLGNGAPDLFSSFNAITSGASDLGVGALLGGGTFVTTVVVAAVCFAVDPFLLNRRPFVRDVGFYFLGVVVILGAQYDGHVTSAEAWGVISIYILYVLTVVIARHVYQNIIKPRRAANNPSVPTLSLPEEEPSVPSSLPLPLSSELDDLNRAGKEDGYSGVVTRGQMHHLSRKISAAHSRAGSRESSKSAMEVGASMQQPLLDIKLDDADLDDEEVDFFVPGGPREWLRNYPRWIGWHKQESRLDKFALIAAMPLRGASFLTVPMFAQNGPDNWDARLAAMYLFIVPIWTLYAVLPDLWDDAWFIVMPVGAVSAVIGYFVSKTKWGPKALETLFLLLAFFSCVGWVELISTEVVALLNAFGVILDIPLAILGLTVLAWGNSLGDLVADTTIARQGYPVLAMGATYASPMLNLIIGYGVSMVYLTSKHGGDVHVHWARQLIPGFIFLSIVLFTAPIIMFFSKWHMNRKYGTFLLIWYLGFLITSIVVALTAPPIHH